MNTNQIPGKLAVICCLLSCSLQTIAQTPTLQQVTTSGNVTTNPVILNRILQTDSSPQYLIMGRKNTESLPMTDIYIFGRSNTLHTSGLSNVVMVGTENTATVSNVFLFGRQNGASIGSSSSTAIGYQNYIKSAESIAAGTKNTVNFLQGNAFGRENYVNAERGQAIGYANTVSGKRGMAFGIDGTSGAEMATAMGYNNQALAKSSSSIGKGNVASGEMAAAVGYANTASGKSSSALGKDNISSGEQSVAFGKGTQAIGYKSVAIGVASIATADNSVAIGNVANDIAMSLKIGPKSNSYLFINEAGGVGIGTTDPKGYKLAVAGKLIAEEIKVKLQGSWPDYVFGENYQLPDLKETEAFIKANRHLPGIPSAAEVEKEGISLGEMNALLLKKIEELTLYILNQEKDLQKIREQIKYIERNKK